MKAQDFHNYTPRIKENTQWKSSHILGGRNSAWDTTVLRKLIPDVHTHGGKNSSFFKLDKFLMSTYKDKYAWLARRFFQNSKYLPDYLLKYIIKAIITETVRHQLSNSRTENKPKNLSGWST